MTIPFLPQLQPVNLESWFKDQDSTVALHNFVLHGPPSLSTSTGGEDLRRETIESQLQQTARQA